MQEPRPLVRAKRTKEDGVGGYIRVLDSTLPSVWIVLITWIIGAPTPGVRPTVVHENVGCSLVHGIRSAGAGHQIGIRSGACRSEASVAGSRQIRRVVNPLKPAAGSSQLAVGIHVNGTGVGNRRPVNAGNIGCVLLVAASPLVADADSVIFRAGRGAARVPEVDVAASCRIVVPRPDIQGKY